MPLGSGKKNGQLDATKLDSQTFALLSRPNSISVTEVEYYKKLYDYPKASRD